MLHHRLFFAALFAVTSGRSLRVTPAPFLSRRMPPRGGASSAATVAPQQQRPPSSSSLHQATAASTSSTATSPPADKKANAASTPTTAATHNLDKNSTVFDAGEVIVGDPSEVRVGPSRFCFPHFPHCLPF